MSRRPPRADVDRPGARRIPAHFSSTAPAKSTAAALVKGLVAGPSSTPVDRACSCALGELTLAVRLHPAAASADARC